MGHGETLESNRIAAARTATSAGSPPIHAGAPGGFECFAVPQSAHASGGG